MRSCVRLDESVFYWMVVWCLGVLVFVICGVGLYFSNVCGQAVGCVCSIVVLVTVQHVLCLGLVFFTYRVCLSV